MYGDCVHVFVALCVCVRVSACQCVVGGYLYAAC